MAEADLFAPWRATIQTGELRIPRCTACGQWNWYPLPACRRCQGDRFEWQKVSSRGTLYSWTRVHRAFSRRLSAEIPYVVGIVDLDDANGVRLVCRCASHADDPVSGSPVRLSPGPDGDYPYWVFEAAGQ